MALYQENDVNQADLAQKRFTDRWGVKYLTTYTSQPSKILISYQVLKIE